MKTITAFALAASCAALLTACGGGGAAPAVVDTGAGGGIVTPPTSTVQRWAAVGTAPAAPTAPTTVLPAPPASVVMPNDPGLTALSVNHQFNVAALGRETANLAAAWTLATGAGHAIVVAVIDTGVDATQPDLQGRVLAGYNFLADPVRNADASPRGPAGCAAGTSHGTAVAGVIAANANNSLGVAGIHAVAKILPIRTGDGCTASSSLDVIDAIRWAAGLPVTGAPANTTPAKIINISLGAVAACPQATQLAIDDAIAAGSIVFGAVGNSGGPTSYPANCAGVIAVGNVGVGASGPEVAFVTSANIQSTYIGGTYAGFSGTSATTPIAAGVAALVLSIAPNLTAAGMRRVLMESARPFPLINPYTGLAYSPALTGTSGAGYLDAWRALSYVRNSLTAQIVAVNVPSDGSAASLVGSGLATTTGTTPAAVMSYAWTQVSGTPVTIANPALATTQVVFPAGAGTYVFQLVITDNLGRTATAVQTVKVVA